MGENDGKDIEIVIKKKPSVRVEVTNRDGQNTDAEIMKVIGEIAFAVIGLPEARSAEGKHAIQQVRSTADAIRIGKPASIIGVEDRKY